MHKFVNDKETRHELELFGGIAIICKTHDNDILIFTTENVILLGYSCLFKDDKEIKYTVNEDD